MDFSANRDGIWSLWRRLAALLVLVLASGVAQADWVYGPPYSYNTAWGSEGGFLSVDAAVNSLIGGYEADCNNGSLECGPHSFSVAYGGPHSGTAATITITYIHSDGTSSSDLFGYIWAEDVTGSGFQPKNAGGCRTMCTAGNGSGQDSMGPRGSSGNGTTKRQDADRGTSLEGDPINAANGNEYRQDTDVSASPWLTFRRFYNSSSYVVSSNLGPKWRHSFDRRLDLMPNSGPDGGLLYARRPDGSMVRFTTAGGVWKADTDSAETLTAITDAATGALTGYKLRLAATKETEGYDASGRLLSITDDNGWVTTLTYSDATTAPAIAPAAGLLIAVTDPQGRVLSLRYDTNSRLSQVIDPAGQTVAYAYAGNGNLAKVTFADGTSRQYLYAEPAYAASPSSYPSELTGIIDEKGVRYETTTFNSNNRATSNQFAGGADKISISYANYYSNGGIPADLTTPLGLVVTLGFADDGAQMLKPSGTSTYCGNQCNQGNKSVTYDTNGYPATRTDYKGTVTKTTYDANGLLTQQVDASGTAVQRTTNTTWDATHRVPLTQTVVDANGAVVAKSGWTYNARGQATAECVIDPSVTTAYTCGSQTNAPQGIRQTRYTYCDAVDSTQCPQVGLLLSVDGPRTDVSDVTSYTYYLTTDESGCAAVGGACHRAGDLAQVTDAAGHVTATLAYDRNSRPVRQKDANGVITDVTYTPRGWLATRTVRANADGSASSADATTTLTYDPVGALKSVTDPDGVTVTYSYDDAHRLIDVANGLGEHMHYTLDASGNRIKEETFDALGVSRRSVSRKYNKLGQLVSVTDGLGHVVFDATATGSYDANGNLVSAKDALGTVQKNSFDVLDRLVSSVADANGTNTATKATTSVFALDALNQLTAVTDPDGLKTTYALDGLSNPIGQTSPDTGTQASTFDAAGNALTYTDAKATVATQAFDAIGRRISVSYADSSLNVAFHYDEGNSITGCASSFPIGRLTRVVEHAVTTVYCYDNQGRVIEQRQTQGTVTDTTDYVYTKAGRLAATASPSGLVTQYSRDAAGQITTVTVTPANGLASAVVSSATYLPFGPILSYTLGNGQTITRSYDANYRFTDIVSPALNLHVARDAVGNIVALGNASGASPAIETYTYDALYRLTGVKDASGAAVETYSYSKAGDRLSKTAPGLATGTYGYETSSHHLTTIGAASRTYDANGSTTANASAGTAWGYGYNGRGQLTVLQQGGATVATYVYDAASHRVAKTVGSATTRYVYGPSGLVGEYGATPRDYVWMDDTPVAVVDGTTVAFVHADGLDTPRAVTDAAGAVVWRWAYQSNPFGEQAPTSASGYVLNLRFAGQYYDAEAGTVYNTYRNFDPSTGRYLQSDPIGLAGGISTYSYTESNPLGAVDPLGLLGEKYEYQPAVPTPQMLEAEELLTKLATQAANKVDAECGLRCQLPWIRGTLIHSEFKRLVDAQCPQSLYHTEVSYYDHVEVRYGYPGSSRADVVLGPKAAPIAVYDLKTGWGYISRFQANAYGANLPVGTVIAPIYPVGR
ncbi:RHS repeat-associated core domain-containing protein [Luteibacter sp. SG786]|uniref:RHS repeat-associated core domain-containing protein n=1 Tax=Luteibacter sp. SG786 TaxID=2587130 RepID=UPI00141DD94D|nr:RHS repeat-associated core domain-containing protein [Luteibacter sp. SG786]NII53786.1 RHS repeat-associated protein [Luteibacter sp. SG786]